jgi:hypothetical protein
MIVALVGCEDEPTAPRALSVCGAPVAVTVSSGLTPTFEWTPACRVSVLDVRRVATGTTEWLVLADPLDDRAIAPGVRYGTVPSGALGGNPAAPAPALEAGTSYVVALTVFALPAGPNEVGRQEFTP